MIFNEIVQICCEQWYSISQAMMQWNHMHQMLHMPIICSIIYQTKLVHFKYKNNGCLPTSLYQLQMDISKFTKQPMRSTDRKNPPLRTHPYQIDDPCPTWTSPMTEAPGATNASISTTGALSKIFIRVRCLDTEK